MKRTTTLGDLEIPNYGIPEASTYLHVPMSTLRYWLFGTDREEPLVRVAQPGRRPLLSFKNLVECYVLEVIRVSHNINLGRTRYSLKVALDKYPSKHPFADYSLSTLGGRIYLDNDPLPLTDLTSGGQFAFREILAPSLRRVERNEKGIALRLFPFTRKSQMKNDVSTSPRLIVIDPRVAFGLPVLAESRISTAFLASRFRGGDSVLEMAKDYARSEDEIEEAIIWERAKQAA
jgi:uncharacterized protein (DUF433 family)